MFHHRVIETCFEMLKSSENTRNYDAFQIMDPPILDIVLKLDPPIPQIYFSIKFYNRGPEKRE